MTIEKIYDFLNLKFPVNTAADYDNCGFLIGNKTADVKSAVLALDCTAAAVNLAKEIGANLIITHHPVIFKGLKSIENTSIVHTLIENGISVISMHTNLDIGKDGVCDTLAKTLELNNIETVTGYDGLNFRKGSLKSPMDSNDFASFVGTKLDAAVKYVGEGKVLNVAVCSGSGADYLYDAIENGCDTLVTAEVKHHLFLEAQSFGVTLIDAGHFQTEDIIIEPLKEILEKEFPNIKFETEHSSPIKVCINI